MIEFDISSHLKLSNSMSNLRKWQSTIESFQFLHQLNWVRLGTCNIWIENVKANKLHDIHQNVEPTKKILHIFEFIKSAPNPAQFTQLNYISSVIVLVRNVLLLIRCHWRFQWKLTENMINIMAIYVWRDWMTEQLGLGLIVVRPPQHRVMGTLRICQTNCVYSRISLFFMTSEKSVMNGYWCCCWAWNRHWFKLEAICSRSMIDMTELWVVDKMTFTFFFNVKFLFVLVFSLRWRGIFSG